MYLPNVKSLASPVPELIGGGQKLGVPGYAHYLFPTPSQKYSICLPYKLYLCALVLPRFSIAVLQTPNFGEGEAVGGRGWYRSKELP